MISQTHAQQKRREITMVLLDTFIQIPARQPGVNVCNSY